MFRHKFLSMVIVVGLLLAQSVPHAQAATVCDSAQFISDLTIPDGTSLMPGVGFTKTWRLQNNGTCTWSTSYSLVWVGGDSMGATSTKVPVNVAPGQMVDISINLTTPAASGHFKSLWKLSNATGTQFGIGTSSTDVFWVDINVVNTSAVIYDFVANAPFAQWKSGAGVLPFPGTSGDYRGFSFQVDKPHLEDDSFDSLPGLLVVPQNKYDGYIQAMYPEFQVQAGDKLQTLVNCEFGATGCYVTFRIDYLLPSGVQKTLWQWKEAPDKRFYRASLDLSALAGQKVRFVFMLLASGFASGDRAIWGSPRIVRTGTAQPPAPPATLTPLPPLPATATPITPPPPTMQAAGCDRATFVTDVTVPDGTQYAPGAAFTKTWRLKNAGSCIWTTAYKLIYYSGEQMSAPTTVNLPWGAAYDQTVDISVNMVAPSSAGSYRGYWILANASGKMFGIGVNAAQPVWVDIKVAGDAPTVIYDFVNNACSGEWKSGAGPLPCPGTEGDSKGFVIPQLHTQLEDGTMGPAPSLLMAPQNRYNGYIMGTFPAFTVQPGDHFLTGIGCQYNHSCYVTFRLDYMTSTGYIGTFWQAREQNDKKNYSANVDLTPLAGRSIRFILTILATGYATNDRTIWTAPRIVRINPVTAVPPTTPAPPTITPVPADWLLYNNSQYGFQFKYPPQTQIVNQSNSGFRMQLPIIPGTNLAEKYLEGVVAENATTCSTPFPSGSPTGTSETVTINGISFLKETGGDAAAGSLYEWVAYSTLRNNICVSMGFVLHSHNPGAFATPPVLFDKAAESAVFAQMMNTFAWTTPTTPPIVSNPQINKLYMIDASNGWAIGSSYVLRTSDGGATWYNVSMPNTSSFGSGFFQNGSKGWVLAKTATDSTSVLLRTTNGGSTWTLYNVPFSGGTLQFLDDTNGLVMAGEQSGMHKHAVQVYQTADGGASWSLKYASDPTQPNNSLPFSGIKFGMTFRDTNTGWIGGYIPTPGLIYLYKTTNGGQSWALQTLPLPNGYQSADMNTTAPTFFGPNDAVLPVWMTLGVGQRDLFLYTTHDGGTTWSYSAAFARGGQTTEFVSTQDSFSWNMGGFLQATNDSGNNWRQITSNTSFGEAVRIMDFVSLTTGWVLDADESGNTTLHRTSDGGTTWTLLFGSTAPPPTQLLPDLTITSIHIELGNTSCLDPNDTMGVRVWIKNNGNSISPKFTVRVNNVDQTSNSWLGIGESTVLFFPGYSNPVSVTLDPANLIQESNETNNTRSEMVAIPTPPLPCVTPASFAQDIVNALNAKNFDTAKSRMASSFMMAFWQSQGNSYPPDAAILQVQSYMTANTVLTSDPNRDLVAVLGGSNPYQVMGLDPATSLALFVSGWGADTKDEAILYVTRQSNGTFSWYGLLIAPGGFARFIQTPTALQGPYAVARVASNDVLNIRGGAGTNFAIVGWFPPDATHVMRTGLTQTAEGAEWWQIQREDGLQGWVNSNYLTEYVTPEAFCADGRVLAMIEQLKGSMLQSNGDMFASMVGPKQGVAINLWRGVPAVQYTHTTARNIFSDTSIHDWGSPPGVGGPSINGTFAGVVQPEFATVFNSNYQLGCDNPSYAQMYVNPWPHTNIHFYSILKPPTANVFDWKVWLVGFEYENGTPYLYGTVLYIWEP